MKVCNTAVDNQAHKCHSPPQSGGRPDRAKRGPESILSTGRFLSIWGFSVRFSQRKAIEFGRSLVRCGIMYVFFKKSSQATDEGRQTTDDGQRRRCHFNSIQFNSNGFDSNRFNSGQIEFNSIGPFVQISVQISVEKCVSKHIFGKNIFYEKYFYF